MMPSPLTTITVCLEFNPFILRDFEILSRGGEKLLSPARILDINRSVWGGGNVG